MKLPTEVKVLLGVFRAFGQEMYVVGGAVRDHVLGKEIRDYDMYLQTADKDEEELRILADRMGMEFRLLSKPEYGGLCVNMRKGDIEIEVMGCNVSIEERINQFPVNVSMVYLKEDGTIFRHRKFQEYVCDGKLLFDWSESDNLRETQDAYELKIRRKFA